MESEREKLKTFIIEILAKANRQHDFELALEELIIARESEKDRIISRWKIFEKLTPSGSEFVNCPETCFDYIKSMVDSGHEAKKDRVRLQKRISEAVRILEHSQEFNHLHAVDRALEVLKGEK
jgi:hypothetical protein